jgi:hypothetical protein
MRPFLKPILIALTLSACAPVTNVTTTRTALSPASPASSLDAQVRVALPADLVSVQQATEFLLQHSGYQLALRCPKCDPAAPLIAAKPISPLAYAKPGQITSIKRALVLVLGNDDALVIDASTRTVSFKSRVSL